MNMEKLIISCIVFTLSLSTAFAAIDTDALNKAKNELEAKGVTLPPEFKDLDLPNVEDAQKLFKDKCIKVSGSDAAYEEANQASTTLMDCVQKIVNVSALPDEIELAKPNGNLDTVFNKYCNRRNEAIECVDQFTKALDPCLTVEEKDQKIVFINITKSLLEFICHENGNQIALFIAEEGPECFSSKQDELQDCVNKTMGKYFNGEIPTIDSLPSLIIKEENCYDMDRLEKCAVKELETCKESTPANLVEALFRFVRKQTPCKKYPKKIDQEVNSSDITRATSSVIFGTWLMALAAKVLVMRN